MLELFESWIVWLFTIVVLLVCFYLGPILFSKRPTNVVLLIGPSDSGKTALFSRIIFNRPKKSVTSLKENEATIQELRLKLVDLPGLARLRDQYWERYKSDARHVVFFLDSTTVENQIRETSEYLYVLLSDEHVHKNNIQFTIACNKQDLDGAKKKDLIKVLLEKELNAIKGTKTGQLGKTSNEAEEDYLVKQEKISLDSLKVGLIEISLYNPDQLLRLIL